MRGRSFLSVLIYGMAVLQVVAMLYGCTSKSIANPGVNADRKIAAEQGPTTTASPIGPSNKETQISPAMPSGKSITGPSISPGPNAPSPGQKSSSPGAPGEATMGNKATPKKDYLVKQGDCLWNISKQSTIFGEGSRWPAIYKANKAEIKDPKLIYPDQKLQIPVDDISKKSVSKSPQKSAKGAKGATTSAPKSAKGAKSP